MRTGEISYCHGNHHFLQEQYRTSYSELMNMIMLVFNTRSDCSVTFLKGTHCKQNNDEIITTTIIINSRLFQSHNIKAFRNTVKKVQYETICNVV